MSQGKYISCGVYVPVEDGAAMRTRVYANRQGFQNVAATARADLRRAAGIHLHELSTSIRGFVLDHGDEPRPTGIADALGDVAAGEPFDVQVLDRDQAKPLYDPGRLLVVEVAALVRRVFVSNHERRARHSSPG